MKVIAYIDGFNLYYGALKRTPYKWLNIDALLRKILYDSYSIIKIKYFTARISSHTRDVSAPKRQAKYLRVLKTLPHLEIYQGHFLAHPVYLPLIKEKENWKQELGKKMKKVCVFKSGEKGTDVNLACHLLLDAFDNQYDCAVIISNDSDFELPIKKVITKFRKQIILLIPGAYISKELKSVIEQSEHLSSDRSFYQYIKESDLRNSQFSDMVNGIFKPKF